VPKVHSLQGRGRGRGGGGGNKGGHGENILRNIAGNKLIKGDREGVLHNTNNNVQ